MDKLSLLIIDYFEGSKNILDVIENLINTENINKIITSRAAFISILRHCTDDKIDNMIKLFLKFDVDIEYINDDVFNKLISEINHDNILGMLQLLPSDFLCLKIINHKLTNHDLILKILKYAFTENKIKFDSMFVIYDMINIFINKYDSDDAIEIFKIIIKKISNEVKISKIFSQLLNSSIEYSTAMLKLLLDKYSELSIKIPLIEKIIKNFTLRNKSNHDDIELSIKSFITGELKSNFYDTCNNKKIKIIKIEIFIEYLKNTNQMPSDGIIYNILNYVYDNDGHDEFCLLLNLKFCPTDASVVNKYRTNIGFKEYMEHHFEIIKLTEQIRALTERNDFLENALIYHPGGTVAIQAQKDFELLSGHMSR